MQSNTNYFYAGSNDVQNHATKFDIPRKDRKPLSSLNFNHSSSIASTDQKDSLKKQKKRSDSYIDAKSAYEQGGQSENMAEINHFDGIFRKKSQEVISIWRDEWNLKIASNIETTGDDEITSKNKKESIQKLFSSDIIDPSNLESQISNRYRIMNNFQATESSDDFWSAEMDDLLTLRIANPINESDDEA